MTGVECCPRECPGRFPGCAVGCERWAQYAKKRVKRYQRTLTQLKISTILVEGWRKTARR